MPRTIRKFILIESDIEYPFKFADRKELEKLKARVNRDEEIIIVKKGLITDTSFSNLCFFDPDEKKWFTPATPLLEGTKMNDYERRGILFRRSISVDDLPLYRYFCPVNAMLDLSMENAYTLNNIIF